MASYDAENDGVEPAPKASLFPNLDADNDDNGLMEIESLCMNCHEQGMTRLMLTKIPFFREVIVSSFQCEECGHSDRSIQSGGKTQERGVRYILKVSTPRDLNREVVKSEYAVFSLPSLEFEQMAVRKGDITTVEGLIDAVISGILIMQDERRAVDPESAEKIDAFVEKMKNLKTLKAPFEVVIDDPSGNSYVENPSAPSRDPALTIVHYIRTKTQEIEVGCLAEEDADAEEDDAAEEEVVDTLGTASSKKPLNLANEVLQFPTNCPNCNAPCKTNMKLVDIPYFKQVVIMATVCEVCGVKDNEVKGGTGIEPLGTKITLHITNVLDLSRDVLKSDTCAVLIPELELELVEGTLGGRFTTVEGLLVAIRDQLMGKNMFLGGDSSQESAHNKMAEFCQRLDKVISGETVDVHLILDDAAGNSYMQNIFAPDLDPEMTVEHYERSFDQNELLGLNDMKTENYATS